MKTKNVKKAKLGKRVVLIGSLKHVLWGNPAMYNVRIIGDIEFRGSLHHEEILLEINISPTNPVTATDWHYHEFPSLKAIKKFRDILAKYLIENMNSFQSENVLRAGIEIYLETLFAYSEKEGMREEALQALRKLNLENPIYMACLHLVLDALDIEPACETELMVKNEEMK